MSALRGFLQSNWPGNPYKQHANPAFDAFIRQGKHQSRLLIVFEGEWHFSDTMGRLERLGTRNKLSVLMVRTPEGDPYPLKGWVGFFSKFKRLGIDMVIVDGRETEKIDLKRKIAELSKSRHRFWQRHLAVVTRSGRNMGYTWDRCADHAWANFRAKGYRARVSRKFA